MEDKLPETLYDITKELSAMQFLQEFDPEDENIQEHIDTLVEQGLDKVESYVRFLKFIDSMIDHYKSVKRDYDKQLKKLNRLKEMLNERTKEFLQQVDGMKVTSLYAKISLSDLGYKVVVEDIDKVPQTFKEPVVTYKLRDDAENEIIELYKQGISVDGVRVKKVWRLNKRIGGEFGNRRNKAVSSKAANQVHES